MADPFPLSALLSHALVAFTIEFDNEFERQTPHRTTDYDTTPVSESGSPRAPWLVSMVMRTKFLQFVPDAGIPARELQRLTRLSDKAMIQWLTRLSKWWGYVVVGPNPSDPRPNPPRAEWLVRPTPGGQKALEVWRPLTSVIEKRWVDRLGSREIEHLREAPRAVASQLDPELPDSLPILGYGLFSKVEDRKDKKKRTAAARRPDSAATLSLLALLSRVLLAFAIEFERESEVSLAISANVLRLVDQDGARVRDLPRLAGVSREAITMATSFLEKRGYAAVKSESAGSKVKVFALTSKGRRARDEYDQLVWAIEERWQERFGPKDVGRLRESLEQLVGEPTASPSPLFRGLRRYAEGWRASLPKPETLPHYPMILHRGGFPDGS